MRAVRTYVLRCAGCGSEFATDRYQGQEVGDVVRWPGTATCSTLTGYGNSGCPSRTFYVDRDG